VSEIVDVVGGVKLGNWLRLHEQRKRHDTEY
jgi:hypothetical protein